MKSERLRGSERKKKDDKHSNSIFNVTEIAPFNAAPEFLNFSFNKRKRRRRICACVRVDASLAANPSSPEENVGLLL